jgi:hypothetical protein
MELKRSSARDKSQVIVKIFLVMAVIFAISLVRIDVAAAKTKTAVATKKPVVTKIIPKKKTTKNQSSQTKVTVKWAASGLKALGGIASFDYSYAIRNATIKKIENYARRKNIKVITAAVINSINE